jgi:DNA repair protein RecO (recombination protein O)
MTSDTRRIQLARGYLLHQRPYRETGGILEVFTREHGRFTLFARGVRGPRATLAAVLQPFQLLLLSWTGRGEAGQLTGAECAAYEPPVPAASLLSAFYLSELILKLTTRHDPNAALFDDYQRALADLRAGGALEPPLRLFEKRLLEAIGYGLDLTTEAATGEPIEPQGRYHFAPQQGLVAAAANAPDSFSGASLIGLAREQLAGSSLDDARRLLRAALAECLEGRPLMTRTVARAVAGRSRMRE